MENKNTVAINGHSPWRSTHCWSCKHPINSDADRECPICGWLICHICGACSGKSGNCVDTHGFSKEEMEYVRQEKRNNPGIDEKEISALIHRVAADKTARARRNHQKQNRYRKEMEEQQDDRVKEIMQRIEKGDIVLVGKEGCRFDRFMSEDGRIRAYFILDSGYKQSFYLPDAFLNGRLHFAESLNTLKK